MSGLLRRTSVWLALVAAVGVASCKDVIRPDATGSIVVRVQLAEATSAPVAGSPGDVATHLTAARATATSGTTTRSATLTGGASGFTGTITDVPVGTYTVTVEGLVNNEVDYFAQQTGVTVRSGQSTTANPTFSSFVPTLSAPASPTTSFRPPISFAAVTNATSYIVEVDRSSTFPNPVKSTFAVPAGAGVGVSDTGTHYVRVRAANSTVASGGRASAAQSFRVVTDQRPSGDTFGGATNLGFFSATAVTLDSLNIYPANDADWFQLNDCNGDSLTITAQAVRLSPPSPLNTVLALFSGATGRLLGASDNADSTDARIRMLVDADGNYRIAVLGAGNTTGHYKLVVQPKAGANNAGTTCRLQPLAVTQISAGREFTCAVRGSGIVDCWGWNAFGQLGNGTAGNASSSPVRVSTSQTFSSATAGGVHACGLTGTGAAYCWGRNANSQLGNGGTTDASAPLLVSGGRTFQKITAGTFHTCALETGGAAYCWGSNLNGKLGNGTTTTASTPTLVSGGLLFQAIGAGDQHTCGLTTGGAVYCWGDNLYGQLGNGTNTDNSLPVFVGSGYSALAVGGFHTCALAAGVAKCWGRNTWGQLGNATFTDSNLPVNVAGALTFSAISAGRFTTCGIVGTSTYCWGDNFDGEVGDNSTTHRSQPVLVSTSVTFQSVSVGGFHTCAVRTTTGDAYCWGWNNFGQLGDGSAFEHTGPVAVSLGVTASKVSAGQEHSCALRTDAVVSCWGWNEDGQLGDGSFTDRATPAAVLGLSNLSGVAAGALHSCALNPSGVAYCWGDNVDGQLGNGTGTSSASPVTVTGNPSPFTAIAAGDYHTCGLGQNGIVYCWGDNLDGQLGNGTTNDALSPTPISSGLTFKQVTAGGGLTCALSTGNVPYCWGDNGSGGVGNGTTSVSPVTTPTQLQAPAGVTFASLTAGLDFACGVTTTGTGYCWGNNDDGQLGNNSTTSSSTPVQVAGGLTWKTIVASRRAGACGITSTDALYCWGDNFTGQLGNGTFTDASTPTVVLVATTFQAVQTGESHTCGVSTGGVVYCWGNDERGELGRGVATTIRKTPVQVITGPASVPVLAASFDAAFAGSGESIEQSDPGDGRRDASVKRPLRGRAR